MGVLCCLFCVVCGLVVLFCVVGCLLSNMFCGWFVVVVLCLVGGVLLFVV